MRIVAQEKNASKISLNKSPESCISSMSDLPASRLRKRQKCWGLNLDEKLYGDGFLKLE